MSVSIEEDIQFENFETMCRFCFKTNILLHPLFDENETNYLDNDQTKSSNAFKQTLHILNKFFGLEVSLI